MLRFRQQAQCPYADGFFAYEKYVHLSALPSYARATRARPSFVDPRVSASRKSSFSLGLSILPLAFFGNSGETIHRTGIM
jgi:hypothetical protein